MRKRNRILGIIFCLTLLFTSIGIGGIFSASAAPAEPTEPTFTMTRGAALRLEELSGLRFEAVVNNYDASKNYGMLITPYDYLEKAGITSLTAGEDYVTKLTTAFTNKLIPRSPIVAENLTAKDLNGKKVLQYSVTNLLENNYDREFFGIAFIKSETGVYSYAAIDNNTRDIVFLASSALNDYHYNTALDQATKDLYLKNKVLLEKFVTTGVKNVNSAFAYAITGETTANIKSVQLSLSVPANMRIVSKWASSNENIATIDQNGLLTPKAKGAVTITASSSGLYTDTHEVTVKFETTTLAAPVLAIANNRIEWSAVPNATGYSVQVGTAAAVTVTDCFYAYAGTEIANISIKALGDEIEFLSSAIAEIKVGKAGADLVKVVGDIEMIWICHQEPTYIQIQFNLGVFQAGAINASGVKLLINGVPCTDLAIAYGNEIKLNFSGTFPTMETAENPIPTMILKANSLIVQGGNAYRVSKDVTSMYNSDTGAWVTVTIKEPKLVSVDNRNPEGTLTQIAFAEDVWDYMGAVNTKGLNIVANGAKVKFTEVSAPSGRHIRMYGDFLTAGTGSASAPVPTFVIKAGSVAVQFATGKAIIFTKDYVFTCVKDYGWFLSVLSDIKMTYPESPQSIQFGFTGTEKFVGSELMTAAGMKIKFNGEYIDATKLTYVFHGGCQHFYIRGTEALKLPTTNGSTITIEKGSIMMLAGGGSFIITNTLTLNITA